MNIETRAKELEELVAKKQGNGNCGRTSFSGLIGWKMQLTVI